MSKHNTLDNNAYLSSSCCNKTFQHYNNNAKRCCKANMQNSVQRCVTEYSAYLNCMNERKFVLTCGFHYLSCIHKSCSLWKSQRVHVENIDVKFDFLGKYIILMSTRRYMIIFILVKNKKNKNKKYTNIKQILFVFSTIY